MVADSMVVQLRDQIKYDGKTHRRREVLTVPARVAEHLLEYRKARLIDRTDTGNGRAQ
jgi:hypothetical protein